MLGSGFVTKPLCERQLKFADLRRNLDEARDERPEKRETCHEIPTTK